MAYKPGTIKGGRGPQGKVKIAFNTKGDKVKIILREVFQDETFKDHTVILDRDNCPSYVKEGMWMGALSADLAKLVSIRPITGMFEMHVQKFAAAKDKPPAPTQKKGQFGDYATFIVLLEITEGDAKEMIVPLSLPYNFGERKETVEGELHSVVGYTHPDSKFTAKLEEFMDVTGAWERGPIKYSDNVLPTIEKRVLHEDRHFKVIMKNGYADTFYQETVSEDITEEQ